MLAREGPLVKADERRPVGEGLPEKADKRRSS
jgi:hypothetical protein